MNRKTLTLTALVVTAGLTVAACGGGSDWESDVRTYAMAGETDESIAETCEGFAMFGLETEADAVDMVLAMASTDADTPIAEVSDVLEFTDENGDVVDISYPSSVTAGEVATVTANELLKHCDLEQAAADVQAELEESFVELEADLEETGWATDEADVVSEPQAYGDDAELDALWDAATNGDYAAAEQMYWDSPAGSEYESYANELLSSMSPESDGTNQFGEDHSVPEGEPNAYGDDPYLDGLWDAAEAGDMAAAEELYQNSYPLSEYEAFAQGLLYG